MAENRWKLGKGMEENELRSTALGGVWSGSGSAWHRYAEEQGERSP